MLKLSVFLSPTGAHVGGWRHPEAWTDAGFTFDRWPKIVQIAERGKIDMVFLADGNGVNGIDEPDMLERNPTVRPVVIEPVNLLSAIAPFTKNIGLVATMTTTYDQPFSVARRFAALDTISGGRGGWNVVTGSNPDDAKNFNRDEHVEHGDRFDRAEEFVDVVKGLWNSWDADAFLQDKDSGRFLDASKVRTLDHKGAHFSVRGPLNAARSPQGEPVIVVAGASTEARDLAARTADVIFTVSADKASAIAFAKDVRDRAEAFGRPRDSIKILPGLSVFVGETVEQGESLYRELQDLIPPSVGVPVLSKVLGMDLSGFDVDGPLPDLTETRGMAAFRDMIATTAKRDGMTIRQVYQMVLPARGHVLMKGSAADVAAEMGEWYASGACDGFNLVGPYLPGGLEMIVDVLVPELQRQGLFRTEYEGATLRENLGVTRY